MDGPLKIGGQGAPIALSTPKPIHCTTNPNPVTEKEKDRDLAALTTKQPYQVLPPLSAEVYAALKADIAERGVQVPVEYDQDGNIIDGHHRVRICSELGIADWPRREQHYFDEAAKRTQARRLNLARRHLSAADKRDLIEQELIDNPARSNRAIASDLGVSDPTVGAVRHRLEATAKISQLEKTKGKDGKERPAKVAKPEPEPEPPKAIISATKQIGPETPANHWEPEAAKERIARAVDAEFDRYGATYKSAVATLLIQRAQRLCPEAAEEQTFANAIAAAVVTLVGAKARDGDAAACRAAVIKVFDFRQLKYRQLETLGCWLQDVADSKLSLRRKSGKGAANAKSTGGTLQ